MVDRDIVITKVYDILCEYDMSSCDDNENNDGWTSGEVASEVAVKITDAILLLIEDQKCL